MLWRYPEEDIWAHLGEKRCLGQERVCAVCGRRGVEMKANTHSSPATMGSLVSRIASGIPFAKHSLGQAPIPSLSHKFLSPYSFLYTQYLLYGMERHLQHCNNHVMLCTEIWGESTFVQHNACVCMYLCLYCKQKNVVRLSFLSWLIEKKSSLFPAACVRSTGRGVSHSYLW